MCRAKKLRFVYSSIVILSCFYHLFSRTTCFNNHLTKTYCASRFILRCIFFQHLPNIVWGARCCFDESLCLYISSPSITVTSPVCEKHADRQEWWIFMFHKWMLAQSCLVHILMLIDAQSGQFLLLLFLIQLFHTHTHTQIHFSKHSKPLFHLAANPMEPVAPEPTLLFIWQTHFSVTMNLPRPKKTSMPQLDRGRE